MAEGYARVTGEVGVCVTIPGPGASNAYTGLLEGFTACTPVLLITAQNYKRYAGRSTDKVVHGLDQLRAFGPVTKICRRVEKAEEIPEAVFEVFGALRSGRPKPGLLEITRDALGGEGEVEIPERNEGTKVAAPYESIEEIISLLRKAKRPVIVAGRGVYHANAMDELREVAELIGAPVATTAMGKGVFSERNSLWVGCMGNEVARRVLAESDLVLAIGCRFVQIDTDSWSMEIPHPLIQIDADAKEINREYHAEIGIVADPKLAMEELVRGMQGIKIENGWGENLERYRNEIESSPKPGYLMKLREAMSDDAILSVDVHMHGYEAMSCYEVNDPRSFLHSPLSSTMGYALPAAMGAKVAYPNREVVVFCGDGGFMLSSAELATAMKYNLNVVVIVMNNNCYGTIKDVQLRHFGGTVGVDLFNPDFVTYAEAFKAYGSRVDSEEEFEDMVRKALKRDKLTLIEVRPKGSFKGRLFRFALETGWRVRGGVD
jgi:acetolactate synthase-1/2/3 large subunit